MSDNLSPPTLDVLCDELRLVVEWDQVALSLKVSYVDIKSIETQYSELAQRKMHSLQKWLDQTNTVHSWRTIADAVEKVNPAVAENIRTKYATILDSVLSTTQHEKTSGLIGDQTTANDQPPVKFMIEEDMVEKITAFERRFAKLVADTLEYFQERPKKRLTFYQYLSIRQKNSPMPLPDLPDAQITYNMLFNILDNQWHYLKCKPLKAIVEDFLSDTDLPNRVQEYQDDLASFKGSTKMKDLIDNIKPNIPSKVNVVLKVKEMWLDVTLEHFEFLVKLLFEEYADSLYVISVKKGCMCVVWGVPEVIAFFVLRVRLSKLDNEMLKAIGVISLTVGSIVVFNNEDSQDNMTFDSALLKAIQSDGPLSAISLLLEVGGNPNLLIQSGETVISTVSKMKSIDDTTALYIASEYGYSFFVSSLLSNGANPNLAQKDGATPLMVASENGHGDIVELLLEKNVTINTQTKNGITAVYKASHSGHSSVVSILLHNGADPNLVNDEGGTPLMVASQNGHGNVVELLLEKNVPINTQDKSGATSIYFASQNGHPSVVSILLSNGADPNLTSNEGVTPLLVASENGHGNVVELLLEKNVPINTQDKNGTTAIYFASQNGHSSVVSILLHNGADPNLASNEGVTPLIVASENGHGDVVEFLLEKNVPINIQAKNGVTAIYLASRSGHSSVVSILLSNGADPNLTRTNGWTPLLIASVRGHNEVVRELLKTHVNIDHQTSTDTTALHLSSQYGYEDIVRQLLEGGANPLIRNNLGMTPQDIAHREGHRNIVSLLREAMVGSFHNLVDDFDIKTNSCIQQVRFDKIIRIEYSL